MMHTKLKVALVLTCVLGCPSVKASDPLQRFSGCVEVPNCIGRWCPDDYCPKQAPFVGVALRFGCDDYCKKRLPCACGELDFTCDNYCKKLAPKVCCAIRQESMRGGPRCGLQVAENSARPEARKPADVQLPLSDGSGSPSRESSAPLARPHFRLGAPVSTPWQPVIVESQELTIVD